MKIKNKKAMEGGMWWIIISAIVAMIVAGIILFIVKGGLSAGKENIDILGSCGSQGGHCKLGVVIDGKLKSQCDADETSYHKFGGCSDKEYCCIKKQT